MSSYSCSSNINFPDLVKNRSNILWLNGFGYEPPKNTNSSHFIICYCSKKIVEDNLDLIKRAISVNSLELDEWIGHVYLKIHWSEYSKINQVFTTLLQLGISFTIANRLKVKFPSDFISSQQDQNLNKLITFNPRVMELQSIKHIKELQKHLSNEYLMSSLSEVCCDPWNWETAEGRDFCMNVLRPMYRMPNYPLSQLLKNKTDNYYLWNVFEECDFTTLLNLNKNRQFNSKNQDVIIEQKEIKSDVEEIKEKEEDKDKKEDNKLNKEKNEDNEDKEKDLCMICFTLKADTQVLPCQHVVVCHLCSEGLKFTNDKNSCIRCRQSIEQIVNKNYNSDMI